MIDDLIVYLTDWGYRVVVNAATRAKDLAWMQAQTAGFAVRLNVRDDLSMLAIQGPNARARTAARPQLAELIQSLKVFQGVPVEVTGFVARTGYTGEDGLEIMLPTPTRRPSGASCWLLASPPLAWRARHPASGSRHESVRPRYGRNHQPAGRRHGLDHRHREPASRDFIGRAAGNRTRRRPGHEAGGPGAGKPWRAARSMTVTSMAPLA